VNQSQTILQNIRALKLQCGDLLALQVDGFLTPNRKRDLEHEVIKATWGMGVKVLVIEGATRIGKIVTIEPTNQNGEGI
jgi:hypothetical protein